MAMSPADHLQLNAGISHRNAAAVLKTQIDKGLEIGTLYKGSRVPAFLVRHGESWDAANQTILRELYSSDEVGRGYEAVSSYAPPNAEAGEFMVNLLLARCDFLKTLLDVVEAQDQLYSGGGSTPADTDANAVAEGVRGELPAAGSRGSGTHKGVIGISDDDFLDRVDDLISEGTSLLDTREEGFPDRIACKTKVKAWSLRATKLLSDCLGQDGYYTDAFIKAWRNPNSADKNYVRDMIGVLVAVKDDATARPSSPASPASQEDKKMESALSRSVFIIHGRDYAAALELKDLIRDKFPKLVPVILANEPWSGTTIIEKFEREAKRCGFAFAVFTPDDNVVTDDKSYHQMRPNVIYELGWFHAQVGRSNTCILYKNGTQIPTDLQGLGWCPFDTSVKQAFIDIERELKATYGDDIC